MLAKLRSGQVSGRSEQPEIGAGVDDAAISNRKDGVPALKLDQNQEADAADETRGSAEKTASARSLGVKFTPADELTSKYKMKAYVKNSSELRDYDISKYVERTINKQTSNAILDPHHKTSKSLQLKNAEDRQTSMLSNFDRY